MPRHYNYRFADLLVRLTTRRLTTRRDRDRDRDRVDCLTHSGPRAHANDASHHCWHHTEMNNCYGDEIFNIGCFGSHQNDTILINNAHYGVKMTTASENNDENFVKMTFPFQRILIVESAPSPFEVKCIHKYIRSKGRINMERLDKMMGFFFLQSRKIPWNCSLCIYCKLKKEEW